MDDMDEKAMPRGEITDVAHRGSLPNVNLPEVTASSTFIAPSNMGGNEAVTSPSLNTASSLVVADTSPETTPLTTRTSTPNNNEDDDSFHKGISAQFSGVCNGVIRNTSYPTLSSMKNIPDTMPPPVVKKSVSTVFSSNNRKSWQLSLSNYSQENAIKKCSSTENTEYHELQLRTNNPPRIVSPDSDTVKSFQTKSKVFVYSGDLSAHHSCDLDHHRTFFNLGHDHGLNSECLKGGDFHSNTDKTGYLVDQKSQSRPISCPLRNPETVMSWSDHSEPHQLKQSGPAIPYHPPSQVACTQDSIELSLYQINEPSPPSKSQMCAEKDWQDADSITPCPEIPASSPAHCDQSVSVLRTSDQSDSVSFSSHGKRKDSDRTVRYSVASEPSDGNSRRRNQNKEYSGCEKRVSELGMLASDCPPDTQPLLPMFRVRVDAGSQSASPDMCVDNTLVRFHSLDSKEPYSQSGDRERPTSIQRAVSVNTGNNLTLEPSHLLVTGTFGSSSPTSSESLAAPQLNELYRYHVFLSHCSEDVGWVQEVVARLQAPPYSYKCAYSPQMEKDQNALEQSLLCSAMLSERVVLVLSKQYVQETWFVFEKILRQLTQMSLHNQRIMGVLLEDCDIPDTLGELYFLDTSDPDFFDVFTKRLKTGRIPRSSESVSSDLAGRNSIAAPSVVNGQTLAQCTLAVKVGWDSYLQVADAGEELPPSLKSHGINLEKTEFYALVHNVSTVLNGSNKLPWVLCVQPLLALLLAAALWLPAFIAVLAVQVDERSGLALPVRLVVFVFPLGIVSCGYLLKWRRRYWLSKIVRVLVQNCVKANQLLYCEGKPVLTTARHVRANNFAVFFIYFDLTDCVRSVDLLLFTCLEDDWDKLMRLVEFYSRDKTYLSQVSMSERLTVMTGSAYLLKLVRGVLPHPPQQRHMSGQLCLCQFTEECATRFVHSLDREDVPALTELFTRHLFGIVSGSAIHRINTELFHRLQ